jgi:hypothetical protein
MRRLFIAVASLAAMSSLVALAQGTKVEPGRGLLPKPDERPAKLEGVPTPYSFKPDPSGGLSRTILETDEDPNFKIIVRDFMIPPDKVPHTVTFSSALFLHFFGEPDSVKVSGQPFTLHAGERTAIAANAPVEVVNKGERSIVVRALIVEAK